jgi:hypothetical protein
MCRLVLFVSLVLASVSSLAQINQAPTNFTGTNNSQIVKIQQNGTGFGLSTSSKANAPAIYGQATPTTGPTFAIWGDVFSPGGIGVRGESHSTTGGAGIVGITHAGTANLGDGNAVGVHGTAQVAPGVQAIGVLGDVPNGLNGVGGAAIMGHVPLTSGSGCCSVPGLFWNEFGDGANILVGQTFNGANTSQAIYSAATVVGRSFSVRSKKIVKSSFSVRSGLPVAGPRPVQRFSALDPKPRANAEAGPRRRTFLHH